MGRRKRKRGTTGAAASRVPKNHPQYAMAMLLELGEENGPLLKVFACFSVAELLKMKGVSRKWRGTCTTVINNKCPDPPKAIQSNQELCDAITKWCTCDPEAMEELACTYGYPINKWDVSRVTDFSRVFYNKTNFNEYIGDWDVSNATTMERMFWYARSFNQPLTNWNTSKVTTMAFMFCHAQAFNQPMDHFDTRRVATMGSMFDCAVSFNQPLENWDTSGVTYMDFMFSHTESFNQPLTAWDASNVTDMGFMFMEASAFNQCLGNWNCSNVTNNLNMFRDAHSFNHFDTLPDELRDWEDEADY